MDQAHILISDERMGMFGGHFALRRHSGVADRMGTGHCRKIVTFAHFLRQSLVLEYPDRAAVTHYTDLGKPGVDAGKYGWQATVDLDNGMVRPRGHGHRHSELLFQSLSEIVPGTVGVKDGDPVNPGFVLVDGNTGAVRTAILHPDQHLFEMRPQGASESGVLEKKSDDTTHVYELPVSPTI